MIDTLKYDLKKVTIALTIAFPSISALHLFGSRRYRTGSLRSDVDILVVATEYIKPAALRVFTEKHCPPLDLFFVSDGSAVSCANESYVKAEGFDQLAARLDAVLFWERESGFIESADVDWIIETALLVDFAQTVFVTSEAFSRMWRPALTNYFGNLEASGVPIRPLIGENFREVADFLIEVIRRCVPVALKLPGKGDGVNITLDDEYDFQKLFYLVVKPWLPELAREEVAVVFDDQKKNADFNAFGSSLIFEFKYVKDNNTKAQVAKMLNGLSDFYRRNGNVRVLIFAILLAPGVDVDASRWEAEFSTDKSGVDVRTIVIRLPKS